MDIKELMFLKAATGGEVKECAPKYFSASSIDPGDTPTTTNRYGTTINTTSAESNSVTVTQVYNSEQAATSYKNGYVCIGFDKLTTWTTAQKTIVFDADVSITANPESVENLRIILGSKNLDKSITGGKIHAEWDTYPATANEYIELRCGGCSFTLSNCKLSIKE